MAHGIFAKAKGFVYRNARPVDFARWRMHFEEGPREAVLDTLAAYQNADGGFGNALECDAWNPDSAPIQAWAAAALLEECGMADHNHPLVRGVLRYLKSGADFDGRTWMRTVPGNNDHPHAPWWRHAGDSAGSYNPTATLAGFLLYHLPADDPFRETALRIAGEAIADYMQAGEPPMHTTHCFAELLTYGRRAEPLWPLPLDALEDKLMRDVAAAIEWDTSKWETTYACRPSFFIRSRESLFYPGNEDIVRAECAFLRAAQQEDGGWMLNWAWDGYAQASAVSANWWRAIGALKNLLFLKAFAPETVVE